MLYECKYSIFSNIDKLRTYLIDKKYQELEKNKNEKKLSFALAEVLNHLWNDLNIQYYKPEYFKKIISEMNPLFKGIAANEPKDLVLFILETLHKELNNNKIISTLFILFFYKK